MVMSGPPIAPARPSRSSSRRSGSWDREGQKRFRLLDGRTVRTLGDKRYEVQGVTLTAE